MQRYRTILLVLGSAGLSLGLGIAIGRTRTAPAPAGMTAEPREGASSRQVRLPPAVARHAGIAVARATRRQLSPTIELVGSVDFDPDRLAEVGGRTAGRITRIMVQPGSHVRVGQPLAEVESAALGEAAAAYLSARAHLAVARTNAAREAELSRQHVSSAREAEVARANALALQADVRGAEHRLRALGMNPGDVRALEGPSASAGRLVLRAPIEGRVISRAAVLGQVVEPTSSVLRIADLSHVWVQLDVFEKDLARIARGDRAEIRSETYPGRSFHGTVSYIDATIDERTRTANVRIDVENGEQLLRPGQFVTARVTAHSGGRVALAVDRRALVQIEGHPAVFVALGPNHYEARTVALGLSEGDLVEVTRGVAEGEDVVVEGAFALKSELFR